MQRTSYLCRRFRIACLWIFDLCKHRDRCKEIPSLPPLLFFKTSSADMRNTRLELAADATYCHSSQANASKHSCSMRWCSSSEIPKCYSSTYQQPRWKIHAGPLATTFKGSQPRRRCTPKTLTISNPITKTRNMVFNFLP